MRHLSEFCLHITDNVAVMAEDEAACCGEKEKIVTATKKGAAVLDQWLPDYVKAQYHVLQMVSLVKNYPCHLSVRCCFEVKTCSVALSMFLDLHEYVM